MAREPDQDLARGLAMAIAELEQRGFSQRDLADRFGVEPATVSRWKNGDRSFSLRILPELDRLCGQGRGYVLRLAGYVEELGADVEAAISADPALTPKYRGEVLAFLAYARERSALELPLAEPVPDPNEPDEVEIWGLDLIDVVERRKLIAELRRRRGAEDAERHTQSA